jgi:hypothetical protein
MHLPGVVTNKYTMGYTGKQTQLAAFLKSPIAFEQKTLAK